MQSRRRGRVAQRFQSGRRTRRLEGERRSTSSYEDKSAQMLGGELGDVVVEIQELEPTSPDANTSSSHGVLAAEAWMECATALKDHDDARIQRWKEEIDNHLVFAGLFSSVLTALIVEAYKFYPASQNPSPTGKRSHKSIVIMNALWFCSLICSLAAASISIRVKQWLNQYSSGMISGSPEIARVRQLRCDSLKKWRVKEIMLLLPILLQGSLVLFLAGLIQFLAPLDKVATTIASAIIGVLLSFIVITTVLPTFVPDCSYQSPQAWSLFVIFQALKKPIRTVARSLSPYARRLADGAFCRPPNPVAKRFLRWMTRFATKPITYSWTARERILVEERGTTLDEHLLVDADATFRADAFLRNVIQPCLNDMSAVAATKCYYRMMAHRADHIVNQVFHFDVGRTRMESLAILTDITLDTLLKTRIERLPVEHPIRILKTLDFMLVRSLPLTYCHLCTVLFSLLDESDTTVRHLVFSMLYRQVSCNLALAERYAHTGCHDISALMSFIGNAFRDEDFKHFLDACDLVLCLTTLSTSLASEEEPENCGHLRGTLSHLQAFFRAPTSSWRDGPRLLYPISRIAPRLVALERRFPRVLEDGFVDVLQEVVWHAQRLNHDGNWEDKVIILEKTLQELREVRRAGSTHSSTLNEKHSLGERPSLVHSVLTPSLDG